MVVVKFVVEIMLIVLCVVEFVVEVGLLCGVLNVVIGGGVEVGELLGCYFDVDMVSFIGLIVMGWWFLYYVVDSNLKEVVLELGGKNFCIVLDDVEDLDVVVVYVVNGVFWNMG